MTYMFYKRILPFVLCLVFLLTGCQPQDLPPGEDGKLEVLAVESFLADIAQQVAGTRLQVATLIPVGVDPHAFEVTPRDVAKISHARVLIMNGTGYEEWLEPVLENAAGERLVIEASQGLTPRQAESDVHDGEDQAGEDEHAHEGDPHFWLDPTLAIQYVENIRNGLIQADPDGQAIYARNAEAYITQLKELDAWIQEQVGQIPQKQRLIVTNHDSFGYYADRYGFEVVGTLIPSISSGATPSARELARLVDAIRVSNAPAVFLETGANPDLARQLERDTGVEVVAGLYVESTGKPGGEASSYIEMLKFNTLAFVGALR